MAVGPRVDERAGVPRTGARAARLLGLIAWVGLLVAVIVGFTALGRGALATPPIDDPAAWPAWARGRDAVQAAFALLRLAVIALAGYLLTVTVVGVAARLLRWGRLVRAADLLTVPAVRHLLRAALGIGVATAALTTVTGSSRPGPGEPATAAAVELARSRDDGLAVDGRPDAAMRRLEGNEPAESMRVIGADAGVEDATLEQGSVWKVRAGEHFWAVAEGVLARAWGRPPTDAEIVPYWREVIEVNLDRLADPGNPDLVYPGQEFVVPPPPPAP